MLTREDVAGFGSKRIATETQTIFDRLKSVRARNGGSFSNLRGDDARIVRESNDELAILAERGEAVKENEGWDSSYLSLAEVLEAGAGDDHPGHGRTDGGAGGAGPIRPVASLWAAMQRQGFKIGEKPRVHVPPGVIWGAVTAPSDTLLPSDQLRPWPLGLDQRYIFPALKSEPLSPIATAVDWTRQSARTFATPATMRRAITAVSTKPESALTIVQVHSALEQIAHKVSGIPNIVFRNPNVASVVDADLRLGLAEALDAQAIAIINAAGMATGGTGANLAIRIRKAMTTVQAAGYNPDTVALSPADAEALDLLLLDVLNSSNTLPNWRLNVRVGKSVTTGFVFDSRSFGTVYASGVDIAAFEENAGATNTQLARGEFHAITTVEQVGAGAALGAQV
jgi:hypothetical protein